MTAASETKMIFVLLFCIEQEGLRTYLWYFNSVMVCCMAQLYCYYLCNINSTQQHAKRVVRNRKRNGQKQVSVLIELLLLCNLLVASNLILFQLSSLGIFEFFLLYSPWNRNILREAHWKQLTVRWLGWERQKRQLQGNKFCSSYFFFFLFICFL